MANEYGIFNDGAVVLEYWHGVIKFKELQQHESQQGSDLLIQKNSRVLADCREAFFELSDEELHLYSETVLTRHQQTHHKVALVINPETWDIVSNFSEQLWGTNNLVMSFHSLDAASMWLELDSRNVEKRLLKLKKTCLSEQTI
jgi:hypothetical protein